MKPGPASDQALIAHLRECVSLIGEYIATEPARFDRSRLVQDAVIRNLQTLTESSQRRSEPIKATEPEVPWRKLAGFRNVLVHGYLGIDLAAVWSVVEQDLSALAAALNRMAARCG